MLWTVAAYTLQLAALVSVALVAMWVLRLRTPRHALRFWLRAARLTGALFFPMEVSSPCG